MEELTFRRWWVSVSQRPKATLGGATKSTPGERSLWPDRQVPGPLAPLRMDQSTCAIAGRGSASRASARRVASLARGGGGVESKASGILGRSARGCRGRCVHME